MSLGELEQAKRGTLRARDRLESTLGALQRRLHPSSLAGEAWDGVKDKSADLADGALQAVKKRPAITSAVIGVLALFLAREPIRRAVTRLFSDDDSGIDSGEAELTHSAPEPRADVEQGVS
jgi:hypothetical protein